MLTISRLGRWSINYYEKTANEAKSAAMDRQSANGGLGEYYSENADPRRWRRPRTWAQTSPSRRTGRVSRLIELRS